MGQVALLVTSNPSVRCKIDSGPFSYSFNAFRSWGSVPRVFCLPDINRRNTEKREVHAAVGLTGFSHHLCVWHWVDPQSSICFSCHVIISIQQFFYKCHCLPPFCLSRTCTAFFDALLCSDISFGSSPDSNWAVLGRRLISITSPFDLGLSGAPATTAVQSL